ncbi:small G protein signaling modulator 3-like isoform X1 [Dinothrombium tinctorium]|uniref:RUN and TBC1 domain-containing protein 3 n=1 Tax=Dinothrombium tinctorium TaxID=1965070 RepID=A0A3S3SFK2_9ACAR|nr:small G protein signaling modulator 3-like isoform X1 [Dinothrombium tinctorium]RWS14629.1 small G protein signaling modulator 3-like isoform X1 [Dinothrombium tinctorium]
MAMNFVKSLSLGVSTTRDGYQNKVVEPDTVSDTEDEELQRMQAIVNGSANSEKEVSYNMFDAEKDTCSYKPMLGGPFSLLPPSMWPQDILAALSQPEDSQPPHQFDEYGFIIESQPAKSSEAVRSGEVRDEEDESDEPLHSDTNDENKLAAKKQKESELRAKWIAYLEFNYNEAALPNMKWSQVELQMKHCKVLDELVKSELPHSMRPQLWMRFSKGMTLCSNSKWSYAQMCDKSNHVQPLSDHQITRILPSNACFMNSTSIGIERLRRILRVIKWLQRSGSNPISNTHESINIAVIAAHLLLICEEEDAFWLTLSCANELKSFEHQSILKQLISEYCSKLDNILKQDDLDISLITSHWFSGLYSGFIPKTSILFRLWDLYFYYGSIVLFQLAIGLLTEKSDYLTTCKDSAAIFNALSDLPSHINSFCSLIRYWTLGSKFVDHIKPQLNLAKCAELSTSISLLALPSFSNGSVNENDVKTKNIRQTSILMELHDAIVAIGKHFEAHNSNFKANLVPDYSNVDRFDDEDDFNELKRPTQRFRRAKALIDFQRHDPDELGFRKNDIITIISERDEHCWIGEINGHRGWFPAKFVELLNERNGEYSAAGDDGAVPFINDLVRGRLCSSLKSIFFYGLKRTLFIYMHPWSIIETIASACIESDFNSVYSRLVLTRTFRLDEFARVLTPSEMLYRSIAYINVTHESEPMDVKLRSLITIALNQQILHDWFTVICATQPHIVAKYYYNWSYINSPAWKLIKAELKLLMQFPFNLNPNAELPDASKPKSPVSKDGVRDMLVKHHLFSWDI